MFQSARLKLTAWYLLMIMLVTLAFSFVIYQVLGAEIDRFAHAQRFRLTPIIIDGDIYAPPVVDEDLILETKRHLLYTLLLIDGTIFFISGGLGYILAGRTLEPIKEMVEEQNRFISDSSHELRTPLTSLKSAFEVNLRDKNLTLAEARTVISESIEEVDKLQCLSDQLLQLAQYQRPQNFPKFSSISLSDCLARSIKKITPIAAKKNIQLKNIAKDFPIYADNSQLSDVFSILLDNAVKYSPAGSTVTLSSAKTDGSVIIKVSDQGIGIAPEDIEHVFDRFYRADSARSKSEVSGYGLGLSIAKRIINLHHGTITVKSRPEEGSTFSVKIPNKKFS